MVEVVFFVFGVLLLGLQVIWENGCMFDIMLLFDVQFCLLLFYCKLMILNIFFFNWDGVNDGFQVYFDGICILVEFIFEVYDCWGSFVY